MSDTIMAEEMKPQEKKAFVTKPYSKEEKIKRDEAELEEFLEFDFFPRVGGGIGMTRMIAAIDKLNNSQWGASTISMEQNTFLGWWNWQTRTIVSRVLKKRVGSTPTPRANKILNDN